MLWNSLPEELKDTIGTSTFINEMVLVLLYVFLFVCLFGQRFLDNPLLWESMGNFCILAVFERYLSNACTDPHQMLFVYGQCLPTCPLPLWCPSAPGGRGEGELKTQKIGGGLIRAADSYHFYFSQRCQMWFNM